MGIILGVIGVLAAVWLVVMVVGGIIAAWAGSKVFSSHWWGDFWGSIHWIGDHLWFLWIPMVIVGVLMKLAGEEDVIVRVFRGTWRIVSWPIRAVARRAGGAGAARRGDADGSHTVVDADADRQNPVR